MIYRAEKCQRNYKRQKITHLNTAKQIKTVKLEETSEQKIPDMEEVEKQLQVLQTTTDTPQVKYLQHNEIITKLHNLEISFTRYHKCCN